MIRTRSEAWNDGYNAYLRGNGLNHNPFFLHDEFYEDWREGWYMAKEHSYENQTGN